MINTKFLGSPTNIEVYEEDDKYYMRFDCPYEDEDGYYNLHIEKISFSIMLDQIYTHTPLNKMNAKFKTGIDSYGDAKYMELEINLDKEEQYFTLTQISDKVHEVTMDDIEKKFGYKVKIVNKNEGE